MAENLEFEAAAGETQEDLDLDSDFQSFITRATEEAINWREEDLDAEQVENTDFYHGRPFGNEEAGRSRVVSTDVRDVVQAMLPSLMRIFFGPERVVEYRPHGPEDAPGAEQATEYVNYVVREDNPGFLTFHSAFKDAMVRKIGIIKWWWEEAEAVEGAEYSGLTLEQLTQLAQEEGVEYEVVAQYPDFMGVMHYDCTVKRVVNDGRCRIAAVPPEEWVFSPDARSVTDADLVGHVREVPVSDLVALGIDEDAIETHRGKAKRSNRQGFLETARRFDETTQDDAERGDAREPILFGELYVYYDYDGDGIAELRKVWTVGDKFEVVLNELTPDRPFAIFTPDPEPHQVIGRCPADDIKDIQRIKSAIIRGQLDSLTLTLNPRTEAVEGEVNMVDLLNPEIGGVVRVTKPGMMREVGHSFVGKEAFPMLQYVDEQKENRTGISKAAAGLDADALQSATKAAVAATLSGAQQHIEMLARVFAETGMSDLFRGLLRLLTRHQDFARIVRLQNNYIPVDPRDWNADMDVQVNVALGAGSSEEKVQKLMLVVSEQKEQLMQGSPLVSLVEYRRTLARLVELAGFPNSDEFFKPWGQEQQMQYDQAKAAAPQQPSPEMALVQMQAEIEQQKLQLDTMKTLMENDRKRDEMALDFAIKQATAELQYGGKIMDAQLRADVMAAKALMEADLERRRSLPNETTPEMYPEEKIPPTGGGV